jgi:CubicO group peptidase (beta-lactamase class C family)
MKTLLVLLLLIPQARFAPVATVAEGVRKELGAPGLSVAVGIDDELVYSAGFGLADVENNVPARGNTVYRIASISKTFGAVSVLQLTERGKVQLDDPITKYAPSFAHPVTLRQIMLHTSGIRHYKPGENNSKVRYTSLADAIKHFAGDPLTFPAGSKTLYSSHAYNLLAGVVETGSGMPLESYLHENIYKPAKLTATHLEFAERIVPNRARGYEMRNGELRNVIYDDLSVKWFGGGMISSAEDLIRYSIALQQGTLLKAESVKLMDTPGTLTDGTPILYSLGWETSKDARGQFYSDKYGSGNGVSTYLVRIPEKRIAVAVLVNLSRGNIKPYAHRIAEAVLNLF